ncbi:MAG: four helix bundle protein [Nitrospiraceae bacterium]
MRNEELKTARRNIVQEKSVAFASRIIKLSRRLQLDCRELVLSKQLLRSGTSIGANIEEAIAAQSKKDFLAKMSIAMKEAREARYWLRLTRESGVLNDPEVHALLQDCNGLVNLLSSITLTTRRNLAANGRSPSRNNQNFSSNISHSSFHIPPWASGGRHDHRRVGTTHSHRR